MWRRERDEESAMMRRERCEDAKSRDQCAGEQRQGAWTKTGMGSRMKQTTVKASQKDKRKRQDAHRMKRSSLSVLADLMMDRDSWYQKCERDGARGGSEGARERGSEGASEGAREREREREKERESEREARQREDQQARHASARRRRKQLEARSASYNLYGERSRKH
eukprot:1025407-Rhodomonas_salina.2